MKFTSLDLIDKKQTFLFSLQYPKLADMIGAITQHIQHCYSTASHAWLETVDWEHDETGRLWAPVLSLLGVRIESKNFTTFVHLVVDRRSNSVYTNTT